MFVPSDPREVKFVAPTSNVGVCCCSHIQTRPAADGRTAGLTPPSAVSSVSFVASPSFHFGRALNKTFLYDSSVTVFQCFHKTPTGNF